MEQEQKPRKRSFISELVPHWRPTREQKLWSIRIAFVLAVLLGFLTLISLPFGITLWEWVKLLIVPAVIAAGGIWFNRQQRARESEIAEQHAQEETLQAYLDHIGQLMLDKNLRSSSWGDDVRTVARAQTITVLSRLDPEHKRSVLQFLYESELITYKKPRPPASSGYVEEDPYSNAPIIELFSADLRGALLSDYSLKNTNLDFARLDGAQLCSVRFSQLTKVTADGTTIFALGTQFDLEDGSWEPTEVASLFHAHLGQADLTNAVLAGVDLTGANLTGATLRRAYLKGARLRASANRSRSARRSSLPTVADPDFSDESPHDDDYIGEGDPEVDHPPLTLRTPCELLVGVVPRVGTLYDPALRGR